MDFKDFIEKHPIEFASIEVADINKDKFYVFRIKFDDSLSLDQLSNNLKWLGEILRASDIKAVFIPIHKSIEYFDIFELDSSMEGSK